MDQTPQQLRKSDRRGRDRRVASAPVAVDRRKDHRRHLTDRRRDTPTVYSREESLRIREMLVGSVAELACPRCGGSLTLGTLIERDEGPLREVGCSTCRRSVFLTDIP